MLLSVQTHFANRDAFFITCNYNFQAALNHCELAAHFARLVNIAIYLHVREVSATEIGRSFP